MHKLLASTMICLLCCARPVVAGANEDIINGILQTDFIFDRDLSNAPFIPAGWLSYSQQQNLSIDGDCETLQACNFDSESYSQGLGLPLWVSQKHIFLAGETLESDHLEFATGSTRVNTVGGLLAWVSQPNPKWQLGAGVYAYKGFDNDPGVLKGTKIIAGVGGRFRHSPRFHSYYALVYYQGFDDSAYYPYIGLDWFKNQRWTISLLIPWPTVSYAPDKNTLFRFGMIQSGTTFQFDGAKQRITSDFSQWHLGLTAEKRLYNKIWGGLTIGYSGFGHLHFNNGLKSELEFDVSERPFLRLTLNYRP